MFSCFLNDAHLINEKMNSARQAHQRRNQQQRQAQKRTFSKIPDRKVSRSFGDQLINDSPHAKDVDNAHKDKYDSNVYPGVSGLRDSVGGLHNKPSKPLTLGSQNVNRIVAALTSTGTEILKGNSVENARFFARLSLTRFRKSSSVTIVSAAINACVTTHTQPTANPNAGSTHLAATPHP